MPQQEQATALISQYMDLLRIDTAEDMKKSDLRILHQDARLLRRALGGVPGPDGGLVADAVPLHLLHKPKLPRRQSLLHPRASSRLRHYDALYHTRPRRSAPLPAAERVNLTQHPPRGRA